MLEALFGNKNIEKVLLFLFVNNRCYGTKLQRLLKTPLTSLQNACNRLEKGKVIVSFLEGKTKLYELNPAYPFRRELEELLKRAYTLLSPQEKKLYSLVQQEHLEKRVKEPELFAFWERLQKVKRFSRKSRSRFQDDTEWGKFGAGDVLVVQHSSMVILFHERGSWQQEGGHDVDFSNTFRWTLDRDAGMISLEHLRFGPNNPVFLFHLVPSSPQMLASVESHLCEDDAYLATVPWDRSKIGLNWRIIGTNKNEEMQYIYL